MFGRVVILQLFIERRRLFFNENDNSNRSRTFLPSIIARQVRLIFVTSSVSTCAIIQLFGCQSQSEAHSREQHNSNEVLLPSDGLITTRFSQKSLLNADVKYDGSISNSSLRGRRDYPQPRAINALSLLQGGLGILNDGDTYQFLRWSSSSEPILLLFAFDSIREFHSINLDLKCLALVSSSCTVKINVGILDIVASNNIWTNRFQPLAIENSQHLDNTTITHLILAVAKAKGQFVIIQINTKEGLALSEVTFHNRNENEDDDLVPSSIYVENSLRRLESLALRSVPDDAKRETKQSRARLHIFLS